jgi:hypothetical protein
MTGERSVTKRDRGGRVPRPADALRRPGERVPHARRELGAIPVFAPATHCRPEPQPDGRDAPGSNGTAGRSLLNRCAKSSSPVAARTGSRSSGYPTGCWEARARDVVPANLTRAYGAGAVVASYEHPDGHELVAESPRGAAEKVSELDQREGRK